MGRGSYVSLCVVVVAIREDGFSSPVVVEVIELASVRNTGFGLVQGCQCLTVFFVEFAELLLYGIVAEMIDDVRCDECHGNLSSASICRRSATICRDSVRLEDKVQRSSVHTGRGEVLGLAGGRGLVADG